MMLYPFEYPYPLSGQTLLTGMIYAIFVNDWIIKNVCLEFIQ